MKTFGNIEEVFKYFQKVKYLEIDPASATVTVLVHSIQNFEPVQKLVPLSLEKQKIEIKTEQLMEEIDALKAKILILERISLPQKQMDANEGDFEEETGRKIKRIEDQFWKAEEKI